MIKFEVGKSYVTKFAGSDFEIVCTVVSRTENTITIKSSNFEDCNGRKAVKLDSDGNEYARLGRYSFAPSIFADMAA